MTYGFVTTNLLDVLAEPRFNGERVNQALFGEVLRVTSKRHGYLRITQSDGYTGWVDQRLVDGASQAACRRYEAELNAVVVRPAAKLEGNPAPHFLFYGTRVLVQRRRSGVARILLPDGSNYELRSGALAPIQKKEAADIAGASLVKEARRFLGVPYLWGGITPAGFDCSGLVRAVLGRFGIAIPRDTKDQIKAGRAVSRENVRTGDLLFFERHVGLAIGKHRLIHASAGGGGVRINALRPGGRDYRKDLDRSFREARRIV